MKASKDHVRGVNLFLWAWKEGFIKKGHYEITHIRHRAYPLFILLNFVIQERTVYLQGMECSWEHQIQVALEVCFMGFVLLCLWLFIFIIFTLSLGRSYNVFIQCILITSTPYPRLPNSFPIPLLIHGQH